MTSQKIKRFCAAMPLAMLVLPYEFITGGVAAGLIGVVLALRNLDQYRSLIISPVFVSWITWRGFYALSTFWAVERIETQRLLLFIAVTILPISIWPVVKNNPRVPNALLIPAAIFSFIMSIARISSGTSLYGFLDHIVPNSGLVSIATLSAVGFVVHCSRALDASSQKSRYLNFLITIIHFAALLALARRTEVIAGAAAISTGFLFKKKISTNKMCVLAGLLCVMIFGWYSFPELAGRFVSMTESRAVRGEFGGLHDGRFLLWEWGLSTFWEAPFFGHGWGGWEVLCPMGGYEAHSMYVNLIWCTGIVGVSLFIVFAWLVKQRMRFSGPYTEASILVIYTALSAAAGGIETTVVPGMIFMLTTTLVVAANNSKGINKNQRPSDLKELTRRRELKIIETTTYPPLKHRAAPCA